VGGTLGGDTARTQALGEFRELGSGGFGDLIGGLPGLQSSGIGEHGAQHFERGELASRGWLVFDEVGQLECEYLFLCVRVIGVDFETIKVANDKQRRVIQVFTVLKQLLIGGLEVFVFALVFPGEKPAHPNVGETVPAGSLRDAFLESVGIALLIDFRRAGLSQNFANADKMLLRRAAFGKGGALPAGNEFGDG
jgi:hypothetical protein